MAADLVAVSLMHYLLSSIESLCSQGQHPEAKAPSPVQRMITK
jgi:hypothetical protein